MTTRNRLQGNVCYFQSGGPTAVINASFLGLDQAFQAQKSPYKIFVSPYGITGLIQGKLTDVTGKDYAKLTHRPGSFSGSLRKKLKEDDPLLGSMIATLAKYQIRYLFANGGNDSMDTCLKLSEAMRKSGLSCQVLGIPKTIDNDLLKTDHTPGYGSAAKYIANTVLAISLDDRTYEKGRINIVEVMGRDSGYLTASSLLASLKGQAPDFIYVPEVAFDLNKEIFKWEKTYETKGRCLVVVSEGIHDEQGKLISAVGTKDAFGNIQMGGVGSYLSSRVTKDGYKSRAIELSIPQRAASYLLSKRDVNEAMAVGKEALLKALAGEDGVMVTIDRVSNHPYRVKYGSALLSDVGGKAGSLPLRYINDDKDNIRKSFITYVLPLIQGNVSALGDDGLLDC